MPLPKGPDGFRMERVRAITDESVTSLRREGKCVVYWMSRDQRHKDNWALVYARSLAKQHNVPLKVVFSLVPKFLEATIRQFGFMLRGLHITAKALHEQKIPFHMLQGFAKETVVQFAREHEAAAVVCDMSPLRVPLRWVKDVGQGLQELKVPLYQVDAHNIVPVWITSDKQEYAARTIRNKIHKHLSTYLQPYPDIEDNDAKVDLPPLFDLQDQIDSLEVDMTVKEVDWVKPGYFEGMKAAEEFGKKRLKKYASDRNDPNVEAQSDLSPYFHFGQVSVAAVIMLLQQPAYSRISPQGLQAFVEEAVVRRELSDNFCFYNRRYDSLDGAAAWARDSLDTHRTDKREFLYTREQLEKGLTHDDLWNASQLQMVQDGKLHGFLRMYWAKKILEWTESPEQALEYAIYLNDKYELDGRDPNGYVGCMWSIAGIHDQGWAERPVFGKIRFMNYGGCKRKFDINKFVNRYPAARSNAAELYGKKGSQPTLKQTAKRKAEKANGASSSSSSKKSK